MSRFHSSLACASGLSRALLTTLVCAELLTGCKPRDAAAPAVAADTTSLELAAVGTNAPAFTVATLSGDSVTVGGTKRQPVTLVNLWSTTCGPCIAEFPDLQQLHDTYGPRGLRVVAVSTDAMDAKVHAFIMRTGSTFVIGRDPADSLPRKYDVTRALPQTILVSADGRVLRKQRSLLPSANKGFRTQIDQALAAR
jgi:peroxiredoxin